jgi:hypothetical protein
VHINFPKRNLWQSKFAHSRQTQQDSGEMASPQTCLIDGFGLLPPGWETAAKSLAVDAGIAPP